MVISLKIYSYDKKKLQYWRKKNANKIIGKGYYDDYHYYCNVRLNQGEILNFPDKAINVIEMKVLDFGKD